MVKYRVYNPFNGSLGSWINNDGWTGKVDPQGYATGYGTVPKEDFKGNMRKGTPEGRGDVEWDELRYKGNFKAGYPDGYGVTYTTRESLNGNCWKIVYKGNFREGLMQGKGKHWFLSKKKRAFVDFEGTWNKGLAIDGKLRGRGNIIFLGSIDENVRTFFDETLIHPDLNPKRGKMYVDRKLIEDGKFEDWELTEGKSYWPNGKLRFSGKKSGNATLHWENGNIKFKGKVNFRGEPKNGRFYNSGGELIHEGGKIPWYKRKKRKSFKRKWKYGRRRSYKKM